MGPARFHCATLLVINYWERPQIKSPLKSWCNTHFIPFVSAVIRRQLQHLQKCNFSNFQKWSNEQKLTLMSCAREGCPRICTKGSNVRGLVAQWITRLTTDQKIPGSNPGKLESPILKAKWYRKIEVRIMHFQRHIQEVLTYKGYGETNKSW